MADIEFVTIPGGIGTGDGHRVACAIGIADVAVSGADSASVGDDQGVAAAGPADIEGVVVLACVGQQGVGTGDKHRVVGGGRLEANHKSFHIAVHRHGGTVGNCESVAVAAIAHIEHPAVAPEGVAPGHHRRVVGRDDRGIVNISVGINDMATIADRQGIVGAANPHREVSTVAPEGVAPGHQHGVVR